MKRFLVTFVAIMLLFVNSLLANAAANSPYCRISYDSNVGCNTVKYFSYDKKDVAHYDASRFVKFYDGKILLGNSNTLITSTHKLGTNPGWIPDGTYLVWLETDNSFKGHHFATGQTVKLADNVLSIGINADSMAETVTFADGKSVAISTLLPNSAPPQEPPKVQPIPSIPPKQPSNRLLKEWTDEKGRENFEFGKNKLVVAGKNVYFNNFKISELCNSGVKFVGIDSSYKVYLYEDASCSYYRFAPKNLFVPKKIQFAKKGKLVSVVNDTNGFLTKIITTTGTFGLSQLSKKATWKPTISYAINKADYCTYYLAKSTKSYTLRKKGSCLYLGKKLIAKGISKKSNAFGFAGKKIYYCKNGKFYRAKIASPYKAGVIKDAKKITYSPKNGQVIIKK